MQTSADQALERYIQQTLQIRDLSSPRLDDMKSAEDYRITLLHNFTRIGKLAEDNNAILSEYWFPLIEKEGLLTDEEVSTLDRFRNALLNSVSMENLDLPLIQKQTARQLKDAEEKGEEAAILRALDNVVSSAAAIMYMTERLDAVSGVAYGYRDEGLRACEELASYLTPQRFAELPDDEAKEIVLVNARYVASLYDRSDALGDGRQNEDDLETLLYALSLADDPFYVEHAPNYRWIYHRFRALQYITHLLGGGNDRKLNDAQRQIVYEHSLKLAALWKDEQKELSPYGKQRLIDLTCARAAYYAEHIDLKEYKERLSMISQANDGDDFDFHSYTIHMVTPAEYLVAIEGKELQPEDEAFLRQFYRQLLNFVHLMPKKGAMSFLLTYLSDVLAHFIEVPDAPDFETLCLSLIAALHPPTYVHTLTVADLTVCLTKHLLEMQPELFAGLPDYPTKGDVQNNVDAILEYARHAALCHDVGKLHVTETIMTYGRNLLDEEFEMIKCHAEIGAHILRKYPQTAPYANVALLHHKWYDDTAGYPERYALNDAPEKTIISVVTCADCLDASTDAVGRSYKAGKSLDDFLEELREGSGTRYAPYLIALFDDKRVRRDVQKILTAGRDENYRRAYRNLAARYDAG